MIIECFLFSFYATVRLNAIKPPPSVQYQGVLDGRMIFFHRLFSSEEAIGSHKGGESNGNASSEIIQEGKGQREGTGSAQVGRRTQRGRLREGRRRKREVGLVALLALVSKLPHVAVTSKQQQHGRPHARHMQMYVYILHGSPHLHFKHTRICISNTLN